MQSHPPRLMILVAGPYRSGTGDDPAKLAANVAAMEAFAIPLFRAGHVPLVGEWLGLPLAALRAPCASATRRSRRCSTPSPSGSWNGVMPCSALVAHRRGQIGWSLRRGLGGWRSITRYRRCPGARPLRVELCAA